MTNSTPIYQRLILPLGLPLVVFSVCILIALNAGMNQLLATGITIDLIVTAPVVFFLVIRNKGWSALGVVPVIVLGAFIAHVIIPEQFRWLGEWVFTFLLPGLEFGIFGFVAYRLYISFRNARTSSSADSYGVIKAAISDYVSIPMLQKILTTEFAMVYYSLLAWKRQTPGALHFTVHRESGSRVVLGAIIFLILAETFAMHFLLLLWNPVVAWIVFSLSLYTALQLFGHSSALSRRFVSLERNYVHIRYGLFADCTFHLSDVQAVVQSSTEVNDPGYKVVRLALLKQMESHNVVLYLKKGIPIEKIYGIRESGNVLLLHVDEPKRFVDALNSFSKA